MEQDIKQRVKLAMKELEISPYVIAKDFHLNERTVYDQINGNSKIGVATIEALLAYRPDLSAEWLLRGEGSMLRSIDVVIDSSHSHHNNNNAGSGTQIISNDTDMWKKIVAEKDEQITELKADKERLYQLLLKE